MDYEIETQETIAITFTQVFEPEEVATLITYMGMGRPTAYIAYQHLVMIQRELSKGNQLEAEELADDLMKSVAEFFMAHGLVDEQGRSNFLMEEPYKKANVTTIELSWYDVAIFVMVLVLAKSSCHWMVKWD